MSARRVGIACTVALLAGLCGAGSARADAVGDAERAASGWGATVEMAARAWLATQVPTHYVRRTADAAREALQSPLRNVTRAAQASPDAAHAAAQLRALGAWCAALEAAVERADDAAVASLLDAGVPGARR